jgi:hypothetical protein
LTERTALRKEFRWLARAPLQNDIRPEQHGHLTELGGLLEKAQIRRFNVIKSAAHHDAERPVEGFGLEFRLHDVNPQPGH